MIYDCAIIGGGPAGLNAALVLGRAKRSVALFDNNQPRNAVTHASHGFLTRDGVTPAEFRRIAYEEVLRYPSVEHFPTKVTDIRKGWEDGHETSDNGVLSDADAKPGDGLLSNALARDDSSMSDMTAAKPDGDNLRVAAASSEEGFLIVTEDGRQFRSRKLLITAGLKETLPPIPGLKEHYGRSLFYCPYCDGWELRDQPLIAVAADPSKAFHLGKLLYQWSRDLVICTNGQSMAAEHKELLGSRQIVVTEREVAAFHGENGRLQEVEFTDGSRISRTGGFVMPEWHPYAAWRETLGYEVNGLGGIRTDERGRSTVPGLFAAGEAASGTSINLIMAAASGSSAASHVNMELVEDAFGAGD